ncbi:MAG: DUF1540 domain-containing protein [Clostridia bacterium]|nr:DUF1540 domain-containing protein [Clostridia bacterium]
MNNKANMSIGCCVESCKHHCSDRDYCTLDSIMVGTHECSPSKSECTDCQSFARK